MPESLFGEVRYSGAHDQTAADVLNGSAAIGAMNSNILSAMIADGRIGPNELVEVWQTPPYPDYVWATRKGLGSGLSRDIRDAFLGLNSVDEEGRRVLNGMRANGFVPASARDFEVLATIAAESGLLESP